jgi:hypothetical protein
MNTSEKLDVIFENIPGTIEEVAMMVPCHVNTLRKIRNGNESMLMATWRNIDSLYKKALKIKKIMDA